MWTMLAWILLWDYNLKTLKNVAPAVNVTIFTASHA